MSRQISEQVITPAPPRSLRYAVWFMYLGALLSLIDIFIGAAAKNSVLDTARQQALDRGDAPADVDQAISTLSTAYTWTVIGVGIIATLLWVWMAWANSKGHKWARVVATILFAINTIGVISALVSQQTTAVYLWMTIITWLVGLVALYLLWSREASAYIERISELRATPSRG